MPVRWFLPPEWRAPSLSPDGRSVVALADTDGTPTAWLIPVDGSAPARQLGPLDPRLRISDVVWSGPGQVVMLAQEGAGGGGFWTASIPDGPVSPLKAPADVSFIRLLHPQPRTTGTVWIEGIAAGHAPRRPVGRWLDVLAVDTATGRVVSSTENPGDVVEWRVDDRGRTRLAIAVRGLRQELRIPDGSSRHDPWRVTESFDVVRDAVSIAGISPDGSTAWMAAHLGRDTRGVHAFDLTSGRFTRTLIVDERFDLVGPLVVSGDGPMSCSWQRLHPHTAYFDSRWEEAIRQSGSDYPSSVWSPVDVSRDGRRALVEVSSDRRPLRHAVVIRDEPGVVRWLPSRQLEAVPTGFAQTPVEFPARDGQMLTAYITRPAGEGPTPLVVLVHGGPWARDIWGWLPEVQFLASRGWTVLQVNYRGSAGFGRAFQEMPEGDWRDLPTTDVLDGTRWAVGQGYADPSSCVVVGTSFGGYLTLLALAQSGESFRTGASLAGAFDLPAWLKASCRGEPTYACAVERWRLFGSRSLSSGNLRPLLDAVRSPLMLLHAEDDTVVPASQSIDLAGAARRAGIPVELRRLPHGGHTLGTPEEQAAAWGAVEEFLARAMGRRTTRPGQ